MRSFSWKYFTLTGDVDAYMLFKDSSRSVEAYRDESPYDSDEEDMPIDDWDVNG